jgi:hypothetical protein
METRFRTYGRNNIARVYSPRGRRGLGRIKEQIDGVRSSLESEQASGLSLKDDNDVSTLVAGHSDTKEECNVFIP